MNVEINLKQDVAKLKVAKKRQVIAHNHTIEGFFIAKNMTMFELKLGSTAHIKCSNVEPSFRTRLGPASIRNAGKSLSSKIEPSFRA